MRSLTTPFATELAKPQIVPVLFVECDMSGGFIRVWSGSGTFTWSNKEWQGVGHFLGLSQIEEVANVEATGLSLSLSGVPSALVATAYGDFSQGRPARVWLGLVEISTFTIIADPVRIFAGRMDTISDTDDGETAMITVSVETNLTDLKRIRARYFTDEDQRRLFSSDRSLRYVPGLQEKSVYWGRQGPAGQGLPRAVA